MSNTELLIKNLTSKDEKVALQAASNIINDCDIEAFKLLCEKSDFLFDFVKENVSKRFKKVATAQNFQNLLYFFEIYCADYDETFASILASFANEELTDSIYDLLENGTEAQKTYAAKYFSFIPDTIAKDALLELSKTDNESLMYNCALALSNMEVTEAFDSAVNRLNSKDEFEQLKAVKFLVAYGNKKAFEKIYETMTNSAMAENIAAEIPYLVSLPELINSENKEKGLVVLSNILTAMPEIIPLSSINDYQLYEVIETLIRAKINSTSAVTLLKAFEKFEMLNGADEYIYGENNNTKSEIREIAELLTSQSQDFWTLQKNEVGEELTKGLANVIVALDVIKGFKLTQHADSVAKLTQNCNDTVKAYVVSTLQALNALSLIDKEKTIFSISDANLKAIVSNCFV